MFFTEFSQVAIMFKTDCEKGPLTYSISPLCLSYENGFVPPLWILISKFLFPYYSIGCPLTCSGVHSGMTVQIAQICKWNENI